MSDMPKIREPDWEDVRMWQDAAINLAHKADAMLSVMLSDWVYRQGRHLTDCFVWRADSPRWPCNKVHITPNEIPALLWAIAEAEATNEG